MAFEYSSLFPSSIYFFFPAESVLFYFPLRTSFGCFVLFFSSNLAQDNENAEDILDELADDVADDDVRLTGFLFKKRWD